MIITILQGMTLTVVITTGDIRMPTSKDDTLRKRKPVTDKVYVFFTAQPERITLSTLQKILDTCQEIPFLPIPEIFVNKGKIKQIDVEITTPPRAQTKYTIYYNGMSIGGSRGMYIDQSVIDEAIETKSCCLNFSF